MTVRIARPGLPLSKEEEQSTTVSKISGSVTKEPPILPKPVLALAMRNHKRHFLIPAVGSVFCGISYSHVMVESGCSSLLLPFPGLDKLVRLNDVNAFVWKVFASKDGTGAVLRIEGNQNATQPMGQMLLALSQQAFDLSFLRFHLGTESAQALLNHSRLSKACVEELNDFLQQGVHVAESTYVLLGQSFLDQVCCIQNGPTMMMLPKNLNTPLNIGDLCNTCAAFASPLVREYPGFHDFGEDNQDRVLPWDAMECIDEGDY